MTACLVRRVGTSIVILGPKASPQAVAQWNAQNGFSDPVIVQYWHYMYALLHGNLGSSYKLNQSVAALFGERWARSAYLSGMGLLLAILIAIPLGIYTLIGAVLTVLGNLLADIALTIADPRIRLS